MRKAIFLIGAAALFLVGCGSGSENATASETTGSPATAANEGKPQTAPSGGYTAVQAVFSAKCAGCHGAKNPKAALDLTNHDAVLKSGTTIVNPGHPESSLLIKAIKGEPGAKKMPPGSPLDATQIKTIEDWIKDGAKA